MCSRWRQWVSVIVVYAAGAPVLASTTPLGPAFTYQGLLKQAGEPVNGVFDLEFRLFGTPAGGTQIGSLAANGLTISNGVFTVDLDFGPSGFDGSERWLEISVGGTTLSPRQPIMPAPYALFALSGNQGPQGEPGSAGPVGPPGATGPQGAQGPQGPAGAIGPQGSQGPQGTTGPAGEQGPQGATGPQGPTGPAGASPFSLNGLNAVYTQGNVGIGTTTPVERLHIDSGSLLLDSASGNLQLRFQGDQDGWKFSTTSGGSTLLLNDMPSNANRMALLSTGEIGMGTNSPEAPLHIMETSAGTITANSNSIAVFERAAGGFLSILAPDGLSKGILFGNVTDAASGGIVYDQLSVGSELMQFRTGGNSTKMVIDDVGNVGIGTSAPTGKLHVTGASGDGTVVLPADSISRSEIDDEPGMASDRNNTQITMPEADHVTLATRTVTCPADGYVLAIGTVQVVGPDFADASAVFGVTTTPDSIGAGNAYLASIKDGDNDTVTVQFVTSVTAGNHTYHLVGFVYNHDQVNVSQRKLSLIYLPSAYGTVDTD